ncbi:hypothetical protein INR49_031287, partial [Caranx melampygus]
WPCPSFRFECVGEGTVPPDVLVLVAIEEAQYWRPTSVSSISSFQNRDLNQSKSRFISASILRCGVFQRGREVGRRQLSYDQPAITRARQRPSQAELLPHDAICKDWISSMDNDKGVAVVVVVVVVLLLLLLLLMVVVVV